MVVTNQPPATLLPMLRDAVKAELVDQPTTEEAARRKLRACLERVSVSRVFDLEGLWEVLADLDMPSEYQPDSQRSKVGAAPDVQAAEMGTTVPREAERQGEEDADPPEAKHDKAIVVIADSDDEGEEISPSSPSPSPPAANPCATFPPRPDRMPPESHHSPDIIVITHFATLLTALFTRREKKAAHTSLQLLASHLRYATRGGAPSNPLVLIVNTTASPASQGAEADTPLRSRGLQPPLSSSNRPLDPTLQSVFSPATSERRNKPSFGLVFTQLLDLHLLCTRIPREREDAEVFYAPSGEGRGHDEVRFAWVVEVLLDEIGVWEEGAADRPRRSREQRWGAVDVVGARIVDAFTAS